MNKPVIEADNGERQRELSPATCNACVSNNDAVDICEKCGEEFGDCGDGPSGWNSNCVHCGHNIYTTRCPDCDAPEQA